MGKRKATAVWAVLLKGLGLALGVYLAGVLLLALLLARGAVPEGGALPAVGALCLAASLAGGLLTARRTRWGTLPSALLCAASFAAVLAAVGLLCWREEIQWLGQGGILPLCALAGGLLAGVLASRRPRRRRKR